MTFGKVLVRLKKAGREKEPLGNGETTNGVGEVI